MLKCKLTVNPSLAGFAIWILILFSLNGCKEASPLKCDLPCQLKITQDENLTVESFTDVLTESGWLQETADRTFYATYAPDEFSNVLETKISIDLDGDPPSEYSSKIDLYIGYVGGINPDHDSVPYQNIDSIQVFTRMTILESLLWYGWPEGGRVFPFYSQGDLDETNPCPDRSHYIAYYNDGKTIVRAVVPHPVFLNMWTTSIELVYPIGSSLEFTSLWIGDYENMDHRPCLPD